MEEFAPTAPVALSDEAAWPFPRRFVALLGTEYEVERLRAANEALTALVAEDQLLSLATEREPALT